MEIDDDFGDLYADVEVQASTAVSGESSGPLETEQEIESDGDEQIQGENDGERALSAKADAERVACLDNASESEDDLNIVLNDDDDENGPAFPVERLVGSRTGVFDEEEEGGGSEVVVVVEGNGLNKNQNLGDGLELLSPNGLRCQERRNGPTSAYQSHNLQYKYMRSNAAAFPTISKASQSAGMASHFSTSVRGDLNDDECRGRLGSSSVVAQGLQNFSLPWYRSIMDVKIDTFEQKPWRHPGADLTDFFNFGFNEESWKCYCNRMEQVRHQTSSLSRIPTYHCSKPEEAFDAGSEYEKGAHKSEPEKVFPALEIACREIQQFDKPKGRVIVVENSILERQPSMDVRRSVARDSDVVIEITLQDSMEDSSGSGKELARKEGSVCEATENGNFGSDDNLHPSDSVSADELSRESSEGNVERSSKSVPKRCSLLKTASNPTPLDSDNHGSGQISDIDGHLQQNVTLSSSERNTDAMETLSNGEEKVCRDTHNVAPYMVETESLLGEQTHCSPRSSYSGSHCEASGDGACTDSERNEKHLGRHSPNSVTKLRQSVASDYRHLNNSGSLGGRRKSADYNYRTRGRSSTPQDLKHYSRRLHNVSELRSHHIYDDAYPSSDTDGRDAANHYVVGHRRRDKRLHGADAYDREDLSYYNEFGEKISYNQVYTAYSKRPHNRDLHGIGDDRDRNPSKKWDEEEYYHEQRISRAGEEVRGRDRYQYERGLTSNPLNCKERRLLVSNYSCLDEERGTKWRRKADLHHQFRRGMENDEFFLCRNYEDDLSLEKYRYFDKERENLDCKCDRRFPSTRRGGKESGRSERKCNSPSFDWDNLWFISNENEYRSSGGHRSLSSHSFKELHTASGERGHDTFSPRNAYDLGLTERHGRHKRQIWMERSKGIDCFGSNSDAVNTEESVNFCDGPAHFRRKRHYWKPESFHWTEDEYVSGHVDDKFLPEGASFSSERISRHERLDANRKVCDREVKRHRYKLTGEGNSGNHVEKSSNAIHRGKHEQTLLRCRDLGDLQLVVREGKSSGTYSSAGSTIRNKKHENTGRDIDKRQIISGDYNESHSEKAGRNDEKWIGKFPVTEHNEALDIEEGQIMTEAMNEYPVDGNIGSEDFLETSDGNKRSLKDRNATKVNAFDMKKKGLCHDKNKATTEKKIGEAFDDNRILDMIAKMEKRREHFKEPITLKKGNGSIPKPCDDPLVEEAANKQQRPARKRRWGGSVVPTTKVPVYP